MSRSSRELSPSVGSVTSGQSPTSERWEFLPDNEVTLEDSLCVVARVTNFGGPEERAARGLLIAAAPDMLAALMAQEDLQQRGILNMSDAEVADVRAKRRAAIAKATPNSDSGG